MKLIIGGAAQGKKAYARERFGEGTYLDGNDCKTEELFSCKGVYHFHLWIRRRLEGELRSLAEEEQEKRLEETCMLLLRKNPEILILCDEVGCGLVPVDPEDRRYRELVGRMCVLLAKEAQEVHRVICGIGGRIK